MSDDKKEEEKKTGFAASETPPEDQEAQIEGGEHDLAEPRQADKVKVERPSASPEDVRADFQPFYEKEAKTERRIRTASSVLLYILLAGLGLAMLGLLADVLLKASDFRLEVAAAVIVCFALVGVLWKSTSLEAKAGLAAVFLGLILAWPQIKFIQAGVAAPWTLSAELVWPLFFLLALIAIFLGIWLLWSRMAWLPLILSLLILYVALAPVFSLILGETKLDEIILGPSFMKGWPIFLRSGYLLGEVILPLGILLMLILQVRIVFKKHHQTHFGYFYWALFLILASTIGLSALEAQDEPVALPISRIVGTVEPASELTSTPKATLLEAEKKAGEVSGSPKVIQPPAAPALPLQEEVKSSSEPPETTGEQASVPGLEPLKVTDLEVKIKSLEKELEDIKSRLRAQEALIKSLQTESESRLKKERPPLQEAEPPPRPKPARPAYPFNRT
ncbi:MAG: hypothetical protein JRI95_09035 [Deltaproteobacteria bacterium]|nr:hypothetical protein [Deltaproteobacteria bacterium]